MTFTIAIHRVIGILEKDEKDREYRIKYKAKDVDILKIVDELNCKLIFD